MDSAGDLPRLEQEERSVSQRRRRLHERIDFLRGGGFTNPEDPERLVRLEAEEREISRARKELHRRIDMLRAQLANQPAGGAGPAPRERLLERPGADYLASLQQGAGTLPPRVR
jgi:anti-sigma-K factor RsiG